MSRDVAKLDLYGILGVGEEATEKEIVKAYRKTALKCHPDKNPDDSKAAEKFQELSKALEILTDVSARAAYDKIIKSKKAAEFRHKHLDSKRKKFKEDLEAREYAAQAKRDTGYEAQADLKAEIERLRKEGSKLLEREQELLRQRLSETKTKPDNTESETVVLPKLKIKWKAKKDDGSNGGYTYDDLFKCLNKYGDISALIVSNKKNGAAIVEFKNSRDAQFAVQFEKGHPDNPLTLTWLSGKPSEVSEGCYNSDISNASSDVSRTANTTNDNPIYTSVPISSNDRNFESLVLMKMRQAEERRKLIEQMQKEDEAV
ncbi:dnaJ homolog subfamily C member 17-like [Gigantopelta aegis]|uniref:dnaJ homolog subfamily C member 17-like n=1 Tax=Gigantopelta aegis TaxID=1735272 RepID=UPI001B88B994|nr:dnaJ homolog subfamily C member 17-like [Gigantopelta aegis]